MPRDAELGAEYSFFVFDRDYTFAKQSSDLPSLSWTRARALGIESINQVSVGSHKFFHVAGARELGGQRFFLACGAFGGLAERVRYMIRYCDEPKQSRIHSDKFKILPVISRD